MRPGKGLGKEEKGIAKPIRCGLKFDKAGIGYNEKISKEESMRWWEQVYDQTASKIFTTETVRKSTGKIDRVLDSTLTDEELFKACGGRTAHRAARHGLGLNGKLQRIKKQELEAQRNISSNTDGSISDSINCKEVKDEQTIIGTETADILNRINEDANLCKKVKNRKKRKTETDVEDISEHFGDVNSIIKTKKKKKIKMLNESQHEEILISDDEPLTIKKCKKTK